MPLFFYIIMADIKKAKEIADIISQQSNAIDDLERSIYGTEKLSNIDDVKRNVSKLMNSYSNNGETDVINSLLIKAKENKNINTLELEKIKKVIYNNRNNNIFNSMLSEKYTKISKYEDLMIITKLVPKLKDVKKALVAYILSPDDLTKQITLNIDYNGKSLETDEPELYKEINKVLKRNNFTKNIKYAIDRTVTLGEYYMAVLPYEKLFNEIYKKRKSKIRLSEASTITFNKDEQLSEAATIESIYEPLEINKIKSDIINSANNCTIINENGALELFDFDVIAEEVKQKYDVSNNSADEFKKTVDSIMNKKSKSNNDVNIHSSDGLFDINNNNQFAGISGCKIKRLDPRRLIPLQIDDDTILGYYYIENMESMNMIRNPSQYALNTTIGYDNSEKGMKSIYKSLGDLIIKKLDKKFIENNLAIKEQLYDVLHYANATRNKIKVIYLENSEVVKFSIDDGESIFEQALFFGKIYIGTLMTNVAAKMARGNDVRAYWVHTDPQGGVAPLVNNALNTLQKNNRAFYSMTNLSKMVSSFNVFDDLIVPIDKDEKKPIDFDIIQGQDIDLNTDFLEMIEKICIESTGTPLQLIETSNDVDFAKSFSILNIKYMRNILDLQVDLNPSVDTFAKYILQTELIDEDKINIIKSCDFSLQSPMTLLLSNMLDQITNAKDLAGNIAEIMFGQSNQDEQGYDDFIKDVCKKYAPNVPFTAFEEMIQNNKINRLNKQDSSNEDEM